MTRRPISARSHVTNDSEASRRLSYEPASPAEQIALAEADRQLAARAAEFAAEISRFVNLAEERRRLQPPPGEWWWYLDILAQTPFFLDRQRQPEPALA
ncbi:MAG: hypothetical protein HY784_13810 [Chloroflexi bacterium]|nr:hypothetical protein [Chloroflexota bacterium]